MYCREHTDRAVGMFCVVARIPQMNSPRCFVCVFGDPQPPGKDLVESGVHHPKLGYAVHTSPGDILLLYCTGSYPRHPWSVPGIGVVLGIDQESISYRWIPTRQPIPKSQIDAAFEPNDRNKFKNIRFDTHWLFEISLKSRITRSTGLAFEQHATSPALRARTRAELKMVSGCPHAILPYPTPFERADGGFASTRDLSAQMTVFARAKSA